MQARLTRVSPLQALVPMCVEHNRSIHYSMRARAAPHLLSGGDNEGECGAGMTRAQMPLDLLRASVDTASVQGSKCKLSEVQAQA